MFAGGSRTMDCHDVLQMAYYWLAGGHFFDYTGANREVSPDSYQSGLTSLFVTVGADFPVCACIVEKVPPANQ